MMRTVLLAACILVACGDASAPTATSAPAPGAVPDTDRPEFVGDWVWEVDEAASTLAFVGTQEGESFRGYFEEWEAAVRLDPDDLSNAAIDVRIATASARTGDRDRDGALPGQYWFVTEDYPHARFRSTDISRQGRDANSYAARGELEILGAAHPVDLDFTLDINGASARAEGQATLDRQALGIGTGQFATDQWIAYPVQVEFALVATREDG